MSKKNCFNFDITSKNIIPSEFGNTSRDDFLRYQLDNEVAHSLEVEKVGLNYKLRLKTINGKVLSEVYLDNTEGSIYVLGYYHDGKFYENPAWGDPENPEIPGDSSKVFLDQGSLNFYAYINNEFIRFVPDASEMFPGVVKLYSSPGHNTDGTMTQKSITDGVNQISFGISDNEAETLVLDLSHWDVPVEPKDDSQR